MLGGDLPNDLMINAVVVVPEHVPNCCDLRPSNLWMLGFEIVWDVPRRLGYDFNTSFNRPGHIEDRLKRLKIYAADGF